MSVLIGGWGEVTILRYLQVVRETILSRMMTARTRRICGFRPRLGMAILLWAAGPLQAQAPAVRTMGTAVVLTPPGMYFMAPRWSPSGGTLAVSGPQYGGIHLVTYPGGEVTELADEPAAGVNLVWSPTGEYILTSVSRYVNHRRRNALVVFDVLTGARTHLTEFVAGGAGHAIWDSGGQFLHLVTKGGKHRQFDARRELAEVEPGPFPQARPVLTPGNQIVLLDPAAGGRKVIDSVAGRKLNLTVSPDGKRIAFEIVGGHLWVTAIDGGRAVDLGAGSRPAWSPGSERLAYIITEDDGHRILAADVYAINADGTGKVNVSRSAEVFEMHPHWSPDGRHIAWDDLHSGRIYVQEVR